MAYPVNDTLSDADGTRLDTTRTCDSGSVGATADGGTLTTYDRVDARQGRAHVASLGVSRLKFVYADEPATLQAQQVTADVDLFTSVGAYFSLIVWTFFEVRYTFATETWAVYDLSESDDRLAGSGTTPRTTVTSGSASKVDAGRFSFTGVAGTPNSYQVRVRVTGSNSAFSITATVDGVDVGLTNVFSTINPAGNLRRGGFVLPPNATTATAGAQTGIQFSRVQVTALSATANDVRLIGPARLPVGVTSSANYTDRSVVGGSEYGVYYLELLPQGEYLSADATFTLADDAGGTFSAGSVTIPAGATRVTFTYKANAVGQRTITATESTGNGLSAQQLAVAALDKLVVFDGDSRLDYRGNGNTTTTTNPNNLLVPPYLFQVSRPSVGVVCVAVSGQSVADMYSNRQARVLDRMAAHAAAGGTTRPVVFVWNVGNSINVLSLANPSDTPAQIADRILDTSGLWLYCDAVRSAGARVVVCTDARRANVNGGTFAKWQNATDATAQQNFNSAIDAANARIRAEWVSHANALWDWGAEDDPLNPDTSNIYIDGTHFDFAENGPSLWLAGAEVAYAAASGVAAGLRGRVARTVVRLRRPI